MSFPVIDAQLHEIPPLSTSGGRHGEEWYSVVTDVTLGWMDAVGVDLTMLNTIDRELGRWSHAHAPDRFRLVESVRSQDTAAVEEQVGMAIADPRIAALRTSFGRNFVDPDGSLGLARFENGEFEPTFVACEASGMPLFVYATGHVGKLAQVAEAHPDLTLIVDHLGLPQPPTDTPDPSPWQRLDDLLGLARYPKVAVKFCGALSLSREPFPHRDVWPHVGRIVDAFGADRLMWASDIGRFHGRLNRGTSTSPDAHAQNDYAGKHTYADSLAFVRDTDMLDEPQKALLLGGTVQRLLRIGAPGDATP